MIDLTRRTLASSLLGCAATAAMIPTAIAAEPSNVGGGAEAGTGSLQGAGFYRFSLGSKTITILADGHDVFAGASLFAVNADPAEFRATQAALLRPETEADVAMNTLLIEEGGRRILVDAGGGAYFGPRFGRQAIALQNAGIAPEDIDTIIITHGHADHFGGLVDGDGARAFPNAEVIWNEDEYRFWSSPEADAALRGSKLPPAFVQTFVLANQTVLPAVKSQSTLVSGEREVAPGVMLVPAPGHTPHSQVVLLTSGDKGLLVASDTLLLPLQNAIRPEWISAFELDGVGVVDTRRKLLDRAVAERLLWHGYHASFPAMGRIKPEGDAYRYVPEPWNW